MSRRLTAILLLLATLVQGPVVTYAGSTESRDGSDSTIVACAGHVFPERSDCDSCCSHNPQPACSVLCAVPGSAPLLPTLFAISLRLAISGSIVPDAGVAPFAEHVPPHRFRPPIV